MQEKILKFLPWLLVFGLIIYFFFFRDNKLKEAIDELKDAKSQIDSSMDRIDASISNLEAIEDSLRIFKHRSDSLYLAFITTADNINRTIRDLKPRVERLRTTLENRRKAEEKAYKPIKPINY